MVLKRLALNQSEMGSIGTSFSVAESYELLEYLDAKVTAESSTEVIPDDIFRNVLEKAIAWISTDAPVVIALQRGIDEWRAYRRDNQLGNYNLRASSKWRAIRSSLVDGDKRVQLDGDERSFDSLTWPDVARLVTITRGACYAVIDGMVGIRDSEMRSLKIGCMSSAQPEGGGPAILKIAGLLYKTASTDRGVPVQWVAGYDEAINPVRIAIEILEQLPRPKHSEHLFAPMQKGRHHGTRLARGGISAALGEFTSSIGIKEWHFTPHQFRKTFARFVARSTVVSVFGLMRHFKHMSVLMTERYLGPDPEQLSDVYDAFEDLTIERLESAFGAERLGGLAGKRILNNNGPYRGASNAEARSRLAKMTIADPSAAFRLTPTGMCIYDAPRANCGGKIENVGWDACMPCSNFLVGAENLPYWNLICEALEVAIEEQEILGFGSVYLHDQLLAARQIVASIESPS